ncbi:hypothetical protein Syun_016685 [Stephania yunnanensis]|uniref:Uncharacterized protein n=1 Tax=Stephania yunnanensis TaxID=152371 RepID=A0AAP0J5N6_9MAGN
MSQLQRSSVSFRRQGSSGHIWDDQRVQSLDSAGISVAQRHLHLMELMHDKDHPQQQYNQDHHQVNSPTTQINKGSGSPAGARTPSGRRGTCEGSATDDGGQRRSSEEARDGREAGTPAGTVERGRRVNETARDGGGQAGRRAGGGDGDGGRGTPAGTVGSQISVRQRRPNGEEKQTGTRSHDPGSRLVFAGHLGADMTLT